MNTNEVLNKLIAEMERRKDKYGQHWINAWRELEELISFTKSLQQEQPEVDLEKEIETCLRQHQMLAVGKKDFTDIARHFFGLGRLSNK